MNMPKTPPEPPATIAWEGQWLRIRVRGRWEYAERTHADGMATLIIAVTPDDCLLFVEQFRIPLQAPTIEFPAGLVGDEHAGEGLAESAARELLEETGWQAGRVEVLLVGPTSAGLSNERIALCRASDLRRVHDGGGHPEEGITVHKIPVDEVPGWLLSRQAEGYALDPKLWAGLWFARRDADGRVWSPVPEQDQR